jgi:hypothetical protein
MFARGDDYFFGVLHSRPHELWALRMGTWLGVGNDPRYTPTATFETFPFPWPPGKEPAGDPRVEAIAEAARDLVEKRDRWLNPEGASEAELKKRTLTNLYNQRPTWLDLAHQRLDRAVLGGCHEQVHAWARWHCWGIRRDCRRCTSSLASGFRVGQLAPWLSAGVLMRLSLRLWRGSDRPWGTVNSN